MPDAGEGLTEAEILSWRVQPGDVVAISDILAEVETAKAAVELPSPYAGVVVELLYPEGATVAVGAPIISIADKAGPADQDGHGEAPASPGGTRSAEHADAAHAAGHADSREPVLVGYGPSARLAARRARKTGQQPAGPAATASGGAPPPASRARAKPPVRKLARQLAVDLGAIPGTGPMGHVTRDDVLAASVRAAAPAQPGSAQSPGETRTPIRGVRQRTAEAMVASAFTAPHVTEWLTVDVTRTLRLLDRLRTDQQSTGLRLSPLILVIRATLLAIARYPQINARWDADSNEIIQYANVNLGIGAATPRGLIVPNIRAAQRLSASELAEALTTLTADARQGRTEPAQMKDGTFTITNIGVFGVDGGTPILNPGEAAILCLGQIRKQPWAHKGRVRLRDVTTLAMSFDHRLVDGELGSRVLAHIAQILENPGQALALRGPQRD
jgi:2-oxoisovalerate dehydrogenase E2 component (dihydrolipoyl transacylase)